MRLLVKLKWLTSDTFIRTLPKYTVTKYIHIENMISLSNLFFFFLRKKICRCLLTTAHRAQLFQTSAVRYIGTAVRLAGNLNIPVMASF